VSERTEALTQDALLSNALFFRDPLNRSLDALNQFFFSVISQVSETTHPYFTSEKGATLAEDVALVEHLEPLAEWALERMGEWAPEELTMRDALEHVELAQGIRDRFTPGVAAVDGLFATVTPILHANSKHGSTLRPLREHLAVLRRLREEVFMGHPVKHLFLEEWQALGELPVEKNTAFSWVPNVEELELILFTESLLEDEGTQSP